jgi:hypothetical protein
MNSCAGTQFTKLMNLSVNITLHLIMIYAITIVFKWRYVSAALVRPKSKFSQCLIRVRCLMLVCIHVLGYHSELSSIHNVYSSKIISLNATAHNVNLYMGNLHYHKNLEFGVTRTTLTERHLKTCL